MKHCIIIGAPHAGAQLCVSLRQGGWDDDITVIGDEVDLPHHRPPLSKGFLSDDKAIDDIVIRGDIEGSRSFAAFYFKGDKILAVDAVNSPREFMFTKMTLTKEQVVDKQILSNVEADLKPAIK